MRDVVLQYQQIPVIVLVYNMNPRIPTEHGIIKPDGRWKPMNINNEKGWFHIPLIVMVAGHGSTIFTGTFLIGLSLFTILSIPCIWHIPAWSHAKATETEHQYQDKQMWPQQVFRHDKNGLNDIQYSRLDNAGNFNLGKDEGGK